MKYRLEEIVDLKIGRTPPRKEQQWFNQGPEDWKWVSIKDMGVPGRYISKTSETISKDAQVKFNIPIVKKGTVILSFKLTVGRVAIVNEDMLTNEAIAQLPIKDTNMVRPLYLYYLLKNYKFDQLGSTSSIATAVNSSYLKKMEIEIPDIQEQDRVISILQSLDNELELNGNINDNLYVYSSIESTSISPDINLGNNESLNCPKCLFSCSSSLIFSIKGRASSLNLYNSAS